MVLLNTPRPFISVGFGFPVSGMNNRKRNQLLYFYSNNRLTNDCRLRAYDPLNFPLRNWADTIFILRESALQDEYRKYLFEFNGKLGEVHAPFPTTPPPKFEPGYESVIKTPEIKRNLDHMLHFVPKDAWGFYFYTYLKGGNGAAL